MIRRILNFFFMALIVFLVVCACCCSADEVEFVCESNEKTTQCPGPCEGDMFLGSHGLCTQECKTNEDCPHYEEYGELCIVGMCGFICFEEGDCNFSEYSCIENLAVCGEE